MKKALMPILIILAVVGLLAGFAWWYEQKYGLNGPFKSHHGHGGEAVDEENILTPKPSR